MVARIAGSMVVSVAVLIVVSLLVSFGVLWWTGSVLTSTAIGTMCSLVAAFAMDSLRTAVERVNGSATKTTGPAAAGSPIMVDRVDKRA